MTASPTIAGRYALFDAIGAGGMATVQLGRLIGPAGFSRTVAVKRLHQVLAGDPEIAAMLLDEARVAAVIHHPNVVSTLDVVATEAELLIVMEYVHGASLAELAAAGPVPLGVAAAVLSGALHGLHAAHEATSARGRPLDLVHRDVSPQNILVGVDGVAKIADFGVAKALGRIQTTRGGQRKGKLAYMAPEQLEDADVDRRTDIYAAAVVLWEMLTAKRLFARATEGETSLRVMALDVEPPSRHAEGVPPALDAVVMRGLAREPSARFDTARDMAIAIEEAIALPRPHEVGDWVATVASEALRTRSEKLERLGELSVAGTEAEPAARERRAPRRSLSVVALAGVGLAVIASLGWQAFAARREARGAPGATSTPVAQSASARDPEPAPSAQPQPQAPIAASGPSASSGHAARPPKARPQAVPASAKRPDDCDPPFVIDSTGIKVLKRSCLSSP